MFQAHKDELDAWCKASVSASFQHALNAYGPRSPFGLADPGQSLVGNPSGHWDFRLQNSYVTPSAPVTQHQSGSLILEAAGLFVAEERVVTN
jgi:hypothetical protein